MNKLNALYNILNSFEYEIICVTESWLGKQIENSLLLHSLPYSIVRCDRTKRQGGGSCIFIANHVSFKSIVTTNIYDADITCIDIFDVFTLYSFRIINVYSPPYFKDIAKYTSFLDYTSELITIDFPYVIVGDFNVPKIDWEGSLIKHTFSQSSVEKAVIDFALHHNITQHIRFPTRKDNTLDLLFTASDTIVYDLISLPPFGLDKHSDHSSFTFSILTHTTIERCAVERKNFHSADYSIINNYFNSIQWPFVLSQCPTPYAVYDPLDRLNIMYSTFMHVVHDAINTFVPTRKHRPTHAFYPKHIKSLFEHRLLLWQDKKMDKRKFTQCSNRLNKEIKKYQRYIQRKKFSKIKTKYQYVRAFLKTKSRKIPTLINTEGKLLFSDNDKCEAFANTFQSIFNHSHFVTSDLNYSNNSNCIEFVEINPADVYRELNSLSLKENTSSDEIPEIFLKNCSSSLSAPLSFIFQYCVMIGAIPTIWKHSIICPIEKVANSPNPIEYRPISLLPVSSKVFEKIVFSKISSFLENNAIIPNCQHGFQRQKSVTTQLIEVYEDLSIAHENKIPIDIAYFDLSKAFDSVPHCRLIEKLSKSGIRGALLALIKNYLSNRTYAVKVGDKMSTKRTIVSGVPQGSVGGPILFIIYISDILQYCQTENVEIKLFADDLKAYHIPNFNVNSPLQTFIDKFVLYCSNNGLSIALKKCNLLHFGKENQKIKYYISGEQINCIVDKQPVKDLGLNFTSDLKWDAHIDIITRKARRTSFALLKSIKSNDPKLLLNLFKTFVRPTLEFATNVYNPFMLKDINSIEKIQKDFLRRIYKKSNWNLYKQNPFVPVPSYAELLALHCIESLELRRLKSDLILFHKYLHGKAKINIKQNNAFQCRETKTRGEKFKIFPVYCKTNIRNNSFFIRTSKIYSQLPTEIRQTNVIEFKCMLSKCCLSKYLKCKL